MLSYLLMAIQSLVWHLPGLFPGQYIEDYIEITPYTNNRSHKTSSGFSYKKITGCNMAPNTNTTIWLI